MKTQKRHNNLERNGVHKVALVIEEEFGWVFREQPVSDVGIDAFIELVKDESPKGHFLALQIKSGESHVHKQGNQFVHYISNIHYNYWINLNVPIIMIVYLPKSKEIIWQNINKQTLKRTKKKWKLILPQNQRFDISSKEKIEKIFRLNENIFIVSLFTKNKELDEQAVSDSVEGLACIDNAKACLNNIVLQHKYFQEKTTEFSKSAIEIRKSVGKDNPRFKSKVKLYSSTIIAIAKRIEIETLLFSENFAEGLASFGNIQHLNRMMDNEISASVDAEKALNVLSNSFDNAIEGLSSFRKGIKILPTEYSSMKKARNELILTTDMLLFELEMAKSLSLKAVSKL